MTVDAKLILVTVLWVAGASLPLTASAQTAGEEPAESVASAVESAETAPTEERSLVYKVPLLIGTFSAGVAFVLLIGGFLWFRAAEERYGRV